MIIYIKKNESIYCLPNVLRNKMIKSRIEIKVQEAYKRLLLIPLDSKSRQVKSDYSYFLFLKNGLKEIRILLKIRRIFVIPQLF